MKFIILLFFTAIFNYNHSQNVNYDKIDDFTGRRKISVSIEDKKNALNFSENIFKSPDIAGSFELKCDVTSTRGNVNYLVFTFTTQNQIRCFSNSTITFLFDNKNKVTLKQKSNTSCGQINNVTYELFDSDLYEFLNYKAEKARILCTDGYYDADIRPNKKQKIIDTFVLYKMSIPSN